jgi:hypothetical protein
MSTAKLAFLALLGTSTAASAASAPKPSQLVSARAVSTPCPFETDPTNNAFQITSMSTPEGIQAPFAIPAKQVFVITSASLQISGAPPNATAQLYLFTVVGTEGGILTEGFTTTNGNGFATVDRILPTGISVRSGVPLCVLGSAGNTLGSVTGYFAKDK